MTFTDALPHVNATLNATSAVLIFVGRRAAAKHDVGRHRATMLTALGTSSVFLVLYLTRFYLTGTHRFEGAPAVRVVYLAILFSHMLLAIATVPLVFRSIFLGLRNRIDEHRRLVRFTYPIWAYVSVTGVVVYVMLYHLSGLRLAARISGATWAECPRVASCAAAFPRRRAGARAGSVA